MASLDGVLRRVEFRGIMNSLFERTALQHGFMPSVFGADRHGSYVWEATLEDELTRTITLSFTTVKGMVVAESWAVASDRAGHSARRTAGRYDFPAKEISALLPRGASSVQDVIIKAANTAYAMKKDELKESYSLAAGVAAAPDPPQA